MADLGLVSKYTQRHYKVHHGKANADIVPNVLDREFTQEEALTYVVSDLTYIRVGMSWNYVCILLDLFNREIIGFSVGSSKDAQLVYNAFCNTQCALDKISYFHTDRGYEFKNELIDNLLHGFGIQRSLSNKGCPYDNAVAESTFKIIKTEFAFDKRFETTEQLRDEFAQYAKWFNIERIHGTLGYMSPVDYRLAHTLKNVFN